MSWCIYGKLRNEWWFCVLYLLTSRCVRLSMYASISGASIWLNVWNSCISLVYSAQIEKMPLNINWFLNVDSKFFISSRRKNVIRSLKEFRGKVMSSWLNRFLMSIQNFYHVQCSSTYAGHIVISHAHAHMHARRPSPAVMR